MAIKKTQTKVRTVTTTRTAVLIALALIFTGSLAFSMLSSINKKRRSGGLVATQKDCYPQHILDQFPGLKQIPNCKPEGSAPTRSTINRTTPSRTQTQQPTISRNTGSTKSTSTKQCVPWGVVGYDPKCTPATTAYESTALTPTSLGSCADIKNSIKLAIKNGYPSTYSKMSIKGIKPTDRYYTMTVYFKYIGSADLYSWVWVFDQSSGTYFPAGGSAPKKLANNDVTRIAAYNGCLVNAY